MVRDPEPQKRRQLITWGKASTPSVATFFHVDQEIKARSHRAKVRAIDHRVRGEGEEGPEGGERKGKKELEEGKRNSPLEPVEDAKYIRSGLPIVKQ